MARETQNNDSQAISKKHIHHTDFFQSVRQSFERAAGSQEGPIDYFFSIAGYTIRLRFAGQALAPKITPAFAHLATLPNPSPALTVCLWDSGSTGVSMTAPPWSWDAYTTRGEISGFSDGHIHTSFHPDASALSLLDTDSNLGLFWVRDADRLPYYETGAPLRLILNWWLSRHGLQFAHAAAVGTASGGVLLIGQGGAGKSTSSLTCLNSELTFASDDYCVFSNSPVPYAHSIYNTAKVDRRMLQRLPYLISSTKELNGFRQEKALLFLWKSFSQKIIKGFPIRALLLPRVINRPETTLRRTSPLKGIRALAPSTIMQLPGVDQTTWKAVTALAKEVPSYDLDLGSDLSKIPEAISELLARLK